MNILNDLELKIKFENWRLIIIPTDKSIQFSIKFYEITDDVLDARRGYEYFKQFGLDEYILSEIWELADYQSKGCLDQVGFCTAMFLVEMELKEKQKFIRLPSEVYMPVGKAGEDQQTHSYQDQLQDNQCQIQNGQVQNDLIPQKQNGSPVIDVIEIAHVPKVVESASEQEPIYEQSVVPKMKPTVNYKDRAAQLLVDRMSALGIKQTINSKNINGPVKLAYASPLSQNTSNALSSQRTNNTLSANFILSDEIQSNPSHTNVVDMSNLKLVETANISFNEVRPTLPSHEIVAETANILSNGVKSTLTSNVNVVDISNPTLLSIPNPSMLSEIAFDSQSEMTCNTNKVTPRTELSSEQDLNISVSNNNIMDQLLMAYKIAKAQQTGKNPSEVHASVFFDTIQENEELARVVYDFVDVEEGELMVKEGDVVLVISVDSDWCLCEFDGMEGYVPLGYLERNFVVLDR